MNAASWTVAILFAAAFAAALRFCLRHGTCGGSGCGGSGCGGGCSGCRSASSGGCPASRMARRLEEDAKKPRRPGTKVP
ncbi:MAG: hypothetical protein IJ783_09845 [Kiritimatiellae bacterium]|nr:hypothetical protein [Kiritimatiellia bacterium]